MMIDKNSFYSSYLYDYFGYKLFLFSKTLWKIDEFEKNSRIIDQRGYKRKDFEIFIKAEIRQTYFQSIETLFELIFALKPKGNTLFDNEIHFRLADSNWRKNYKTIEKISTDINELNFFDEHVEISNLGQVSIGKHLFYFGINPDSKKLPRELIDSIPVSLNNIKKGLQIMAKDFIKRDEYNSYKHGIRIFPAFNKMSMVDADTMETGMEFDLSDSISYLVVNKMEKKIKCTTRLFETKRDFEYCKFATMLITNIISLRKASLKLGDKEVGIYLFPFDNFDEMNNSNLSIQDISYSLQKI